MSIHCKLGNSLNIFVSMQKSEASKSMSLESAKLLQDGMFVMWNWEWAKPSDEIFDEDVSHESDGSSDHEESPDNACNNVDDSIADTEQVLKHTIAFKCIVASRDPESQKVLAFSAKRKRDVAP